MKNQTIRFSIGILVLLLFTIPSHAQDIILGQGNNAIITVTTSENAQNSNGENTTNSQGFLPNLNAASRFLSQATYGPNMEDIETLSSMGIENWLDNQFSIPRPFNLIDEVINYKQIKNDSLNDPEGDAFDYYWSFAWWQYAMTSDDVLRQRVALALSEFFVISQFSSFGENAYALATYYDMLLNGAFTNYRNLLDSVTYHTAMGEYLTFVNNPKSDTIYELDWDVPDPPDTIAIHYVFPDENYAREVMQLFSIGLCELNLDGTCKQDGNDIDIPTYDNGDIAEFAKIFTGFSYGDNNNFGNGRGDGEETYLTEMQIYDEDHELGQKFLLNGFVVPNRIPSDGHADVHDALDNLFNHPNVGPFFGKFLIQRLITSNPSPAYIQRVAEAFNGQSQYGNVRGDMQSVIKAIYLDEEARNCSAAEIITHGKLREPFIRYVQIGKAFDLHTMNGSFRNALENVYFYIQQKPLTSPSVFNFFQSDYQPIGRIEEEGMVAPEFQITNTQTIAGYLNGLNEWVINDDYVDHWRIYSGEQNYYDDPSFFDFDDEVALATDPYLPQLIERLNLILAHGKLSESTSQTIIDALQHFEIDDTDCVAECGADAECLMYCEEDKLESRLRRVKIAIYIIMASPEYLINR